MGKTFEALQRAEEEKRFGKVVPGTNGHFAGLLKGTAQTVIEHHRLKYNIMRLNGAKKVKCLMFAGSTPGEGTTSVLISFACSLAQDGERVLLVDANLRSPSIQKAFGLTEANGLTDLLQGDLTLAEVIKPTDHPKLSVVTSGSTHPNPFVMLESEEMKNQVEAMKAQADWVLFDSSPIASFNDAAAMAGSVDGVILVIEAERTRWEVAESARKWIKGGNGNVLGVVLNKRKYHIPQWLYKRL